MRRLPSTIALLALLVPMTTVRLPGGVVLNEVMYHPDGDDDALQFIELHNPDPQPVSLTGWKLTKGITFTVPEFTVPAGGFALICRQRKACLRAYGTNFALLGEFKGRLRHGGERLELTDAHGQIVDALTYSDETPWPTGPDGYGSSMERISPAATSEDPHNWAAAFDDTHTVAAATPGRTNSAYSRRLPPVISEVRFEPPTPGKPTRIKANVRPVRGGQAVELRFQSITAASPPAETVLPMRAEGTNGVYSTELPAQPSGRLLRFRIRAVDDIGSTRFEPAPGEPRPTFSAFLEKNTNHLTVPEARLLQLGPRENSGSSLRHRSLRSETAAIRGQSAFVYSSTNGQPVRVFDHIRLTPRAGGWKVRLHKDETLDGMSTLNLVFENQPRWVLSEPLSYEIFRRAGVPAPQTGHVRLWNQGKPMGYHLLVEQPNSSFLRRQKLDPDGNLYKLLWYGNGVVGQHEKKNNPESDHADFLAVINGLNSLEGESQWKFIQEHFNVDEVVNYFAASMCVQNWDGFFNNYFAYHGPGKAGRWEMIPWDQDKTWGDYDGASADFDWYEMPLTYGMKGDREPGSGRFSLFRPRNSPWGATGWWRPGGYFSAPLLANPQFRERFLKRVQTLCQTTFTEPNLLPVIRDLEQRLEPEVRFRARLEGMDPSHAVSSFHESIDSFRRQLKHRRAYLIEALGQKATSP